MEMMASVLRSGSLCFFFVFWGVSDGGSARVRGRAVAGVRESHPVRGATEAGGAVLPDPPHPQRPVSTITCSNWTHLYAYSVF